MAIVMDHAHLQPDSDPASGSKDHFDRLLEAVYDELRRIAHFHRQNELPNMTVQTTALVHEAYLRLINSHTVPQPRDECHMKALTSRIIRRVLVDQARRRNAQKRDPERLPPDEQIHSLIDPNLAVDVLDLDSALNQLAGISQKLASVVELRFFGGLTSQEVANSMDTSLRTAERDWQKARMYLLDLLQPTDGTD
jgi:RNA polymerase sigma factor (TIGR02999 family)